MNQGTEAERLARSLDVEIWITPKESFIHLLPAQSVRSYPHSNIDDDCDDQRLLTKEDRKVV